MRSKWLAAAVAVGFGVVGCEVRVAEPPTVAQSPSPPRRVSRGPNYDPSTQAQSSGRAGSGRAGRRQCIAGSPLDFGIVSDKDQKWAQIQAVIQGRRTVTSPSFACDLAYGFARTCPAWDPTVMSVEIQVCALSLKRDMDEEQQRLQSSSESSGFSVPASAAWPQFNPNGGMIGRGGATSSTPSFVASLARLEELNPPPGDAAALMMAAKKFRGDTLSFEHDARQLGVSCAEIDQLEARASTVSEFTASRYRATAKARRQAQLASRQAEIQKRTSKPYSLPNMDSPEQATADIEPTKHVAAETPCYDATVGAGLVAQVNDWANKLEQSVAEERKCRATPACMRQRKMDIERAEAAEVVEQLCPIIADRREAFQQIAAEKQNPGGVVNLVTLHDLGERIQVDDSNIAKLKSQYTAVAHRPFNGACPR